MKVSICEKCPFYQRRTWSTYYEPKGYHAIGISHAYGYCKFARQRCLEVKPKICEQKDK
jgi:hypothetical protein